MNARSRLTRALAASLTVLVLGAAPVAATESTPDAATEESDRITIPESSHDRFGIILFGLSALAGLGALANAAKQLKGSRPQADGRIRWR